MAMLKTASELQTELFDLMDNHHDIENNDCENTKTKIIFLSFQPEVLLLWHRDRMNMGRGGGNCPHQFSANPPKLRIENNEITTYKSVYSIKVKIGP